MSMNSTDKAFSKAQTQHAIFELTFQLWNGSYSDMKDCIKDMHESIDEFADHFDKNKEKFVRVSEATRQAGITPSPTYEGAKKRKAENKDDSIAKKKLL